jgi:transposase
VAPNFLLLKSFRILKVATYLTRMEHKDRVQYVAMDMWTPYRDAVQAVLPAATTVIDKSHVVRMANDAIERVRKGLRGELTQKRKRGLMHDRFVLLKRECDPTDDERFKLSSWVRNYPALGEVYRLKEGFCGVYENAKSPHEAQQQLAVWNRQVTDELRPCFADLVRAVTNWEPYILNYFTHPVTSAYTERVNGLIRVMSRLGRGYSFEALRAKILFTEGVHRHKQVRPKFERMCRRAEVRRSTSQSQKGSSVGPPSRRSLGRRNRASTRYRRARPRTTAPTSQHLSGCWKPGNCKASANTVLRTAGKNRSGNGVAH